jgi:hypothetical protein
MAQDASKGRLGVITRRMFVGGLAGAGLMREHLLLEAIAAESMPHQLIVRSVEKAPFFELRDYGEAKVAQVLKRHGIRIALEEDGRFLFSFESLASRERAWREISADAEWIALRPQVSEISIYKAS